MGFIEIFLAYLERGDLWKRGWYTQTTALDILYLVVGDEMLRDATNGQRKCL
jgi:hypothetical protein